MQTWDTCIRPYLTRIRWRSRAMQYDVAELQAKPGFFTIAEDDMAHVERELERALERVRNARAAYRDKPVMSEAA